MPQKGALPDELVVPMDRDMIVCWHPEKAFPYEYSLPIPQEVDTMKQNEFLRVGQKDVEKVFHKEKDSNLLAQELAKITYTTKHRWFPKKSNLKSKEKIEPDRPYL